MKVILEYRMSGGRGQAPGAIVLVERDPGGTPHPYVVWFRNDQDSEREGRPCYYHGDYCRSLPEAAIAFGEKCQRFDPDGGLHDLVGVFVERTTR